MKKSLLFGTLIIGTLSFAQEIHYGIIGGLNATRLRNDWVKETDFLSQKSKIGGYAGGYISKSLINGDEIFGEVILTTIGARFVDNEAIYNEDLSFNANGIMLQIPAYYQYSINNKFSIHGGGYAGLLLNLKHTGNDDIEGGKVITNTLDLGFLVGIKYHITQELSGVFRYNFGLLDIDADKYKNNNSILQIGVQYQLK